MGNNQALQVGAEALSGLVGGFAAAAFVALLLTFAGGRPARAPGDLQRK